MSTQCFVLDADYLSRNQPTLLSPCPPSSRKENLPNGAKGLKSVLFPVLYGQRGETICLTWGCKECRGAIQGTRTNRTNRQHGRGADGWSTPRTGQDPGLEGLERPGRDGTPPIGARSPKELVPMSEGEARPFTLRKGLRETEKNTTCRRQI